MDERFFDELVSELYARATLQHSHLHWTVTHFLRANYNDPPANRFEQSLRDFAQKCFAANVRAVNQRYEEHTLPAILQFNKPSGLPKWSDVQLFKHLECLSYQCAEGDVTDSEIYKQLEALIGSIARAVVGRGDQYDMAKWDWAA